MRDDEPQVAQVQPVSCCCSGGIAPWRKHIETYVELRGGSSDTVKMQRHQSNQENEVEKPLFTPLEFCFRVANICFRLCRGPVEDVHADTFVETIVYEHRVEVAEISSCRGGELSGRACWRKKEAQRFVLTAKEMQTDVHIRPFLQKVTKNTQAQLQTHCPLQALQFHRLACRKARDQREEGESHLEMI